MKTKLKAALCCCYSVAMIIACSDDSDNIGREQPLICEIHFPLQHTCRVANYTVEVRTKKVAGDELLLTALKVVYGDIHQVLDITEDTSFLDGDTGYITAEDINFDGHPDLAITTSFATPNLYLDYWVFDPAGRRFVYVGNYSEFRLNTDKKTLHTRNKINAASYREVIYQWRGHKLVRQQQEQEQEQE